MPKQARLDMLQPERGLEQRIVLQVDLAHRQIVRRTPIGMHVLKQVGRQGVLHRDISEIDRDVITMTG